MKRILKTVASCLLGAAALSGCGGNGTRGRNLVSVAVDPTIAETTAPTGTAPFALIGTFDQPPTNEEVSSAQWSSSDPSVATIDASTGIATCMTAGGPVTITGASGQKRGTAQLTCVAAPQGGSGNCVYRCGSTRCGALTGYCSISSGNACRQVYAPGQCPTGLPAGGTATDSCGAGVDTTRACHD